MAKLLKTSLQLPDIDYTAKRMAGFDAHMAEMDRLQDVSNAIDLSGGVVDTKGAIMSFPVADGSAVYIVTRDKPLTLQHIDFGDSYHAHYALIRGLRRSDILLELDRAKAWETLFTENGAKK